MNNLVLYGIIIIVALVLFGIITGENQQAKKLLNKYDTIEKFGPDIASLADVSSGSSTLYDWGIGDDTKKYAERVPEKHHRPHPRPKPPSCNKCPPGCIKENKPDCEEKKPDEPSHYKLCRNCDITLNKDIDQYVLKSSVPPCPDMSKYATKNMVCPQINMDDYILKSKIPPCPHVDMSKYILKSKIPPCPDCPTCPKCPICPVCPQEKRCKKIYEYKITEHPEFNKFVSKDDCAKAMSDAINSQGGINDTGSSGNATSNVTSNGQATTNGSGSDNLLTQEEGNENNNYGMYASFQSCSPYSSQTN